MFEAAFAELRLAKSKSLVHCVNKTMAFSFDNLPLEITCPKCDKQIKETVRWFKADGRKCPFCNQPFETTGFRRGMDEATKRTNEMLLNLQKSLGSLKIKIDV